MPYYVPSVANPLLTIHLSPDERGVLEHFLGRISIVVLDRSRSYANARRILSLDRRGNRVDAEIEGTEVYETQINLEKGKGDCDCLAPKPCKHMAALAAYLLQTDSEQVLFDQGGGDEAPIAELDKETNLCIIFTAQDRVEFGFSSAPGQISHLTPAKQKLLNPNHRKIHGDLSKERTFLGDDLLTVLLILFNENQNLDGIRFYFGRERFSRTFTGFAEVEYRITEDTGTSRRDNFNRLGYDFLSFNVSAQTLDSEHKANSFFILSGDATFRVHATLRDRVHEGFFSLHAIMAHSKLCQIISPAWRHAWENRAQIGPRLLLSFYGVESKSGRLAVEGNLTLAYAMSNEDFQNTRGDSQLYGIVSHIDRYRLDSPYFDSLSEFEDDPESTVITPTGRIIERHLDAEYDIIHKRRSSRTLNFGKFKVPRTKFLEYFEKIIPRERKQGTIVRIHDNIAGVFAQRTASLNIKDGSGIDWFEGTIALEGLTPEEIGPALVAYRKKQALVELTAGKWFSVEGSGLADLMRSLEGLGLKTDSSGTISKISKSKLAALEQEKELEMRTTQGAATAIARFKAFARAVPAAVNPPDNFGAKLRPYQQQGLAYLMKLYSENMGGILADDMGLGKTVQAIAAMCVVAESKKNVRFLVVCPLAAMGVWEHEVQAFAPHLKTYRWHGTGRDAQSAAGARVLITSYATFALDAEKFAAEKFAMAFIDEAQMIKNQKSLAARAIRKIDARCIVCLTGTPLENHLEDLWALFDVIFPGYLGTLKGFKSAFHHANPDSLQRLKSRIRPFLLRRLKRDVLTELPEKFEAIIYVPMGTEQARIYESARAGALKSLAQRDSTKSALFEMLTHLTRLRRISCHPYLEERAADPLLSGKLVYLDEKLPELQESASGVLIFSQFTSVLAVVETLFKKRGIDYLYLDGATVERKRRDLAQKFQAGECKFFLISLKAGGTALTLTQADTVIHLDPWWNPAVENQASDRAHRIGQQKRVMVMKLVSEKTVEEKVLQLQEKKRALFNAMLGEGTAAMPSFSREDIAAILGE